MRRRDLDERLATAIAEARSLLGHRHSVAQLVAQLTSEQRIRRIQELEAKAGRTAATPFADQLRCWREAGLSEAALASLVQAELEPVRSSDGGGVLVVPPIDFERGI